MLEGQRLARDIAEGFRTNIQEVGNKQCFGNRLQTFKYTPPGAPYLSYNTRLQFLQYSEDPCMGETVKLCSIRCEHFSRLVEILLIYSESPAFSFRVPIHSDYKVIASSVNVRKEIPDIFSRQLYMDFLLEGLQAAFR